MKLLDRILRSFGLCRFSRVEMVFIRRKGDLVQEGHSKETTKALLSNNEKIKEELYNKFDVKHWG